MLKIVQSRIASEPYEPLLETSSVFEQQQRVDDAMIISLLAVSDTVV